MGRLSPAMQRYARRSPPMYFRACPALVEDEAPFVQVFAAHARAVGIQPAYVNDVWNILPDGIKSTGCFLDRVTGLWRYEYGEPWSLAPDLHVYGPHLWPLIENLLWVATHARFRLTTEASRRHMVKLANRPHHEAMLVELLPMSRVAADCVIEPEFKTGVCDRDVDWRFERPGYPPLLLEVKLRTFDFIELAKRIRAGERRPNGETPVPVHDAAFLFRSIEEKLAPVSPDVRLQGAWVMPHLMQDETDLTAAFHALDGDRIHFAVLGGWEPGVHVLTKRPEDAERVLAILNDQQVERHVYDRRLGGGNRGSDRREPGRPGHDRACSCDVEVDTA